MQLAVLAAAAFTYVTAELLPVGALPAIARDLHVSVPMVGTLLAWYALVAAVTTIPLVRWTALWPRRRALLLSLACLTVSQLISALAPNFVVLACGRALSAVTHGLILSVIAPIATRLVPASHSGRATTSIYVGISLAVVVGSPATAAISLEWNWRVAVAAVTVVAALVTVAAWLVLPVMALTDGQRAVVGRGAHHYRNRRLVIVSLLTMIAVTGHYMSYTFFAVIVRDVVGVRGPDIAWLLATYGIAGLLAIPLVARPMDHRPRAATISCMVALYMTFLVLTALAFHRLPPTATALIGDHRDRAVGRHRQRGVADAAIRGDARRRRRSRRRVRAVHGGVSNRHHGRIVRRRVVLRARHADDAGRLRGPDRSSEPPE